MLVLPSWALQKWVCFNYCEYSRSDYLFSVLGITSDDCRFPHVTPDGSGSHHVPYYGGRGALRPRQANGNGFPAIEEKIANLSIREVGTPFCYMAYAYINVQTRSPRDSRTVLRLLVGPRPIPAAPGSPSKITMPSMVSAPTKSH